MDTFYDRQTDGQTCTDAGGGGGNNMSPEPDGGDIITVFNLIRPYALIRAHNYASCLYEHRNLIL